MLSFFFAALYWGFAIWLFRLGHIAGGWGTELGEIHYVFAMYVASDAVGTTWLWLKS